MVRNEWVLNVSVRNILRNIIYANKVNDMVIIIAHPQILHVNKFFVSTAATLFSYNIFIVVFSCFFSPLYRLKCVIWDITHKNAHIKFVQMQFNVPKWLATKTG